MGAMNARGSKRRAAERNAGVATRPQVLAAGALVWRRATNGEDVQFGVVHRPRYDDWSFPKGKADPGEHPLVCATREVAEETGVRGVLGRPLPPQRYPVEDADKLVLWWLMEARTWDFTANAEVDEMRWLPAAEVRPLLSQDQDRAVLDAALAGPLRTRPVVVVRHASAGKKGSFAGRDVDRPLDERGEAQAASLVQTFAGYKISHVVSADVRRCLDTVAPLAQARDLTVEPEPLFSAAGFAERPRRTVKRLLRLADEPADVDDGVVVCSQREVIGDLLAAALRERRVVPTLPMRLAKGEFWVSHLRGDRIIAAERWPAVRSDRPVDPAAHLSLHPGRR